MSDTSLYSGLYQQMREYSALLDQVLISLKDGSSSQDDPRRKRLACFLLDLAGETPDNLCVRLISLVLSERGPIDKDEWRRLGNALLAPGLDAAVIPRLERLASSVEHEQVRVMARMRGDTG